MNNNPQGVQAALSSLLDRSNGYGESVSRVLYNALTHSGHTLGEMVRLSDAQLIGVLNEYCQFRSVHPSISPGPQE